MSHEQQLKGYGFRRFARIGWREPEMNLIVEDTALAALTNAVYAFVVGGRVVRIGRFRGPVLQRAKHRTKRITDYLRDGYIPASDSFTGFEAERWREALNAAGGSGCVYALPGAYDREGEFIRAFGHPPCNMCSR